MKIVIPGGSGQIGAILARAFHAGGHEVVVLSRKPTRHPWRSVAWDATSLGAWAMELEGADVVIHLAGRSVNCRYHPANRAEIFDSRMHSTRVIGEAIRACHRPPGLWIQASTATIYSHRYDAANDEHSGVLGGDEPGLPDTWRFSLEVAKAWEKSAAQIVTPGTRKVLMRSAIVMSADRGGAFDILLRLVRIGLGGRAGDGRQFVSWIHERDFVRAIHWLIEHREIDGVVNLAAPNPLPNREFMAAIRRAQGMPFGLPATPWMLELGAWFLRTETELILKSRRVVSLRLRESGFEFEFPNWPEAAADLCARWKESAAGPLRGITRGFAKG